MPSDSPAHSPLIKKWYARCISQGLQKHLTKPLLIAIVISLGFHLTAFKVISQWYFGETTKTNSVQGENTFLVSISRAKQDKKSPTQSTHSAPSENTSTDTQNSRPGDRANVLAKKTKEAQPVPRSPLTGNKPEESSFNEEQNPSIKTLAKQPPESGPSTKQAPAQPPDARQNQQEVRDKKAAGDTYMQHVEYLFAPKPEYPRLSKRLREHGTVKLKVFINTIGKPEKILIHTSSGYHRLDTAAAAAVENWEFKPHTVGNKHTAAWAIVPVDFVLTKR